jgi:hypothetical protein
VGIYKIELVVQDLTSGNVGTIYQSIRLPRLEAGRLAASEIMLAKQLEPLEDFPESLETFVIGDVRVVPNLANEFRATDRLGVYLQIYNPTLDSATLEPAVSIEYTIRSGEKVYFQWTDLENASVEFSSSRRLVLVRRMGLEQVQTGTYELAVKVNDLISGQSVTALTDFRVVADLGK